MLGYTNEVTHSATGGAYSMGGIHVEIHDDVGYTISFDYVGGVTRLAMRYEQYELR